ncbi:PASTA domain-containing protein [Microbacterium maritypicum]|uniref:PASTA domain-containing protein n=1 Tax=Microbacterium maritypicum TaxID=33918 RepID=UPI003D6E01DF
MGDEATRPLSGEQALDNGSDAQSNDTHTSPGRPRLSKRSIYIGGAAVLGVLALGIGAVVVIDQVTRVSVPDLEQQTVAEATSMLEGLDLTMVVRTEASFCEDGELATELCVVASQTPGRDERIHGDEWVTLEVVPSAVSAPSMEGMTFDEAVAAGAEVALEVRPADISDNVVDGHGDWKVVSQSEEGTLDAGSSIKVTLERPLVDARAVIGATVQGAVDALTADGFQPVVASDPGGTHDPAWVVAATDPEIIDGKLPVASRVTLTWGVKLPNVVGMTDLAAKSALSNTKVTVDGSTSSSQLVALQEPAAGTVVEPGSTVTITLEPPSTVYEVVSDGSRGTITWVPPNSYSISQAGDAPLPWRMSWPTASGYRNFNAQVMDGTTVTCNIYVNGQLLKTATSTGRYAVVSCG